MLYKAGVASGHKRVTLPVNYCHPKTINTAVFPCSVHCPGKGVIV